MSKQIKKKIDNLMKEKVYSIYITSWYKRGGFAIDEIILENRLFEEINFDIKRICDEITSDQSIDRVVVDGYNNIL